MKYMKMSEMVLNCSRDSFLNLKLKILLMGDLMELNQIVG